MENLKPMKREERYISLYIGIVIFLKREDVEI